MSRIAYYRVSTRTQSIEAQRHALGGAFDREFIDEGVSGAVMAAERPGFAKALDYLRDGDTLCVSALDRLGRDAMDVQATVAKLIAKGVAVDILGLGVVGKGVGELIVAVLAHVAKMERERIAERTALGRHAAREAFATNGKTHRGKDRLHGRPHAASPVEVKAWRTAHGASIAVTAAHFGVSEASVKRYCAG
jgi:putative DNA-invertase from lambdoid prophage Rac